MVPKGRDTKSLIPTQPKPSRLPTDGRAWILQPPLGGHWNWYPPNPLNPAAPPTRLIVTDISIPATTGYQVRLAVCWGGAGSSRPTAFKDLSDVGRPLPDSTNPITIDVVAKSRWWIIAYLAGYDQFGK